MAFLLLGATVAHAGDGRIEINQARAMAGGVSPLDLPGFPVTLDANSSYVLTGDLYAGPATGLSISGPVDNVTIDLNGFAIRGDGSGSATGIAATGENIEIKNGTVRDFGGRGLFLQTSGRHVVRNLRVIGNGGVGIDSNGAALITDCYVQSNGGDGIEVGSSSFVARNRVILNGGVGIDGAGGTFVQDNVILISNTTEPALDLGTLTGVNSSGYQNNMIGNGGAGGTVAGGVDMGGNLCNGLTSCP